ncbi:MAG: FAD-dependent oxidoreductase [Candidatus Omnitrophota bacterium]
MKPTPVPAQSPAKRLRNFQEVELGFSKRTAVDEARKFPQSHVPTFQPKCPLGINILEFVRLLREGDIPEAYKKIREASDLPGICGRVCRAPCEADFVIGGKKVPLDVRALERFVADNGRPKFFGRDNLTCSRERIAVIGSGPAGLSAAALLAKQHYCVTIFESLPQPGGVLRYGLPEFRISRPALDAEISQIRDLGVDLQTDCHFGRTITPDDIFEEGYAALLLAVGRSRPSLQSIPGSDARGVIYANELLMNLNCEEQNFHHSFARRLGEKISVLGDQALALDCARICRRLGKDVRLVCEGAEDSLDAHRNDIEYARQEGVLFETLSRAKEICVSSSGEVSGVRVIRMDYADPEANGQWVLVPAPDSETVLEADTVIVAKGHEVSKTIQRAVQGLKMNEDGTIRLDEDTGQTSVPRVFAAGDCADPQQHVLDAMVCGKWAAERIMAFLAGTDTSGLPKGREG